MASQNANSQSLPPSARTTTKGEDGEDRKPILKQACSWEEPTSARCVQGFDDSLNSAIHITYRISLRSSSLREPRYPLSKVVFWLHFAQVATNRCGVKHASTRVALSSIQSFVERVFKGIKKVNSKPGAPVTPEGVNTVTRLQQFTGS